MHRWPDTEQACRARPSQARAGLNVQRILDNGMILGAHGDFLLFHDALSGDNYNDHGVEHAYLFAQTGFGRVELGENDGAAYNLGVAGPTVDDHVTLENPDTSLFRDPVTDNDFSSFLHQVTPSGRCPPISRKLTYLPPRLFGIQLGVSYAPEPLRERLLPFIGDYRSTRRVRTTSSKRRRAIPIIFPMSRWGFRRPMRKPR